MLCSKCKNDLPVDHFTRDRTKPTGRYSSCKSCDNKRQILSRSKFNLDVKNKIYGNQSRRQYKCIKRQGALKAGSTAELLGCNKNELASHLETQFTEGMSWDNYGKWHIDHIKPIVSFDLTDPRQQKECFNYTNLQPLWAEDNLRKERS